MRRVWRLPQEIRARMTGVFPLLVIPVLFILFHFVPFVGDGLRMVEANIGSWLTRVGIAVRYVFSSETALRDAAAQCVEEKEALSARLAEGVRKDEEGEVSVIARGYAGDVYSVVVTMPSFMTLKSGDALVVNGGLVGVIRDIGRDTAAVQLLSHTQSHIPVMILGKEQTIGLAVGAGGAWLDLRYVPKDTNIVTGDVVVTSGLGGITPADIPVGVIVEVAAEDASPFLHARLAPIVDPDRWSTAQVVSNQAL